MWVPLVENREYNSEGADYFVRQHIDHILTQSPEIDTLLLACTHYPLLIDKIEKFVGDDITILSQGKIVAKSLADYLDRHSEIAQQCSKGGSRKFLTTDSTDDFDEHAQFFWGNEIASEFIQL